ncbi:MAG: toll/interleukin-1 receptor domain-containing protein [Leptolyngbya sp. SIO1D8]|nr:toll/interleukin-1 receptor domain-containing protein [Leptolyngbya sp. SIO1D8]
MTSTADQTPLKVFISYSHRDEALKKELEEHLALLKRLNKVQIWQDRAIDAGDEWNEQIRQALDAADIILLLVTSRFINSDFCFSKEMNRAMTRHGQGTARVIPVVMAPCSWQKAAFAKLQVLPTDGKPVTEWSNRDSAFLNVTEGITRVVDKLYGPVIEDDGGWSTPPAVKTAEQDGWSDPPAVASTSSSSPSNEAVEAVPQSKTQKRLALFQLLSDIPGPTFDSIVYALNVPPPLMPPPMAPQGQRVPALLNWAQSPVGCGLDELEAVINTVVKAP